MNEKLKTLNCVTLELPSAYIKPGSINANDSGLDSPNFSRRLFTRKNRSLRSKRESGSVSASEFHKFDPRQTQKIETQRQKIPSL